MSDVEVGDIFVDVVCCVGTEGRLTRNCCSGKFDSVGSFAGCDVVTCLIVKGEIEYPIGMTVPREHENIVNFVVDDVAQGPCLLLIHTKGFCTRVLRYPSQASYCISFVSCADYKIKRKRLSIEERFIETAEDNLLSDYTPHGFPFLRVRKLVIEPVLLAVAHQLKSVTLIIGFTLRPSSPAMSEIYSVFQYRSFIRSAFIEFTSDRSIILSSIQDH